MQNKHATTTCILVAQGKKESILFLGAALGRPLTLSDLMLQISQYSTTSTFHRWERLLTQQDRIPSNKVGFISSTYAPSCNLALTTFSLHFNAISVDHILNRPRLYVMSLIIYKKCHVSWVYTRTNESTWTIATALSRSNIFSSIWNPWSM